MNRYPNNVLKFGDLFRRSFRLHYLTLKHTIAFIILITIMKYLYLLSFTFTANSVAHNIVGVIALIATIYFLSSALLATHQAFNDQTQSAFMDNLKAVWDHKKNIFITAFVYVLGIIILYQIGTLIGHWVGRMAMSDAGLLSDSVMLITLILTLTFCGIFFLSVPLSVIDNKPLNNALYTSAMFSEDHKFSILVMLFIVNAVFLLISPAMLQEYFLETYHLGGIFDFVVLCVFVPLFINLLLLVINDARLQKTI